MTIVKCKYCNEECIWVQNKTGKWYLSNVKILPNGSKIPQKSWSCSTRKNISMPHLCRQMQNNQRIKKETDNEDNN